MSVSVEALMEAMDRRDARQLNRDIVRPRRNFGINYGDAPEQRMGPIEFEPKFMQIDHPGSFWLHFPQVEPAAGAWVPPRSFPGPILPAPIDNPKVIRVRTTDVPPGYTVDTSNQIATASISLFDEFPQVASGAQQAGIPPASSSGTAFPALQRAIATYTFTTPRATGKGFNCYIHVFGGGAGTVTVTIFDVDPAGGVPQASLNILASLPIGSGADGLLTVYPGITAQANRSAASLIGGAAAIQCVVATAAVSFSVGYVVLP